MKYSPRSMAFGFLPSFANVLPLNALIRITGRNTLFPFYHLISNEEVPHVKYLYKVRTTRDFVNDLDFLLKHFNPVSITDFLDAINRNTPFPSNSFVLTFDDGLREFYDVVAPVLISKGIPATCFLNSAFIDNKDLFYRYKAGLLIDSLQKGTRPDKGEHYLEHWFVENGLVWTPDFHGLLKINYARRQLLDDLALELHVSFDDFLKMQRPYLDSSQITSLLQKGFTFGAHSIDHPEYRFISEEEQLRQTTESLDFIRQKFGIREKLFCFPFTDYGVSRAFFNRVFDSVTPIADLTFGGAGLKLDSISRNIQRIPFEGTALNAKQILGTEYLYFMIKSIFGKNLIRR